MYRTKKQLRAIHAKNNAGVGKRKKTKTMHRRTRVLAITSKMYQVGRAKNYHADVMRPALRPGKRRTAWGTLYTENRKNRSDMPHSRT